MELYNYYFVLGYVSFVLSILSCCHVMTKGDTIVYLLNHYLLLILLLLGSLGIMVFSYVKIMRLYNE